MKNGICPKCDEKQIHRVNSLSAETGINLSWTQTAYLDYYVCTKCGYVETFVSDTQLLPKIAEKYTKVHWR